MAGAVAADPTPFWLRANVGPDWCGVHADLRRHVPTEVAVLVMLDAQPPTEQSSWVSAYRTRTLRSSSRGLSVLAWVRSIGQWSCAAHGVDYIEDGLGGGLGVPLVVNQRLVGGAVDDAV
jgi:hypothetical protein